MDTIRKGAVVWGGNPADLEGPELKAGQHAPDFTLTGNDMKPVTLKDTNGKVRIVATVPSLDTAVCDTETRRFNVEAATLGAVEILTVSVDLPMAQKRWCGAAGVDKVRTLSDYKTRAFGKAWGVFQPDRALLARATFVLDKDGVIRHAEYCKSPGDQPDYDAVIAAAKSLL